MMPSDPLKWGLTSPVQKQKKELPTQTTAPKDRDKKVGPTATVRGRPLSRKIKPATVCNGTTCRECIVGGQV